MSNKRSKVITIDIPPAKQFTLAIAGSAYTITPILTFDIYEKILTDLNKKRIKNIIAEIIQSDIQKAGTKSLSLDEILNAPDHPCKKYIDFLLDENNNLKVLFEQEPKTQDDYTRFENATKKYGQQVFQNIKDSLDKFAQKMRGLITEQYFKQLQRTDFSRSFIDFSEIISNIQNQIRDIILNHKVSLPTFNWEEWETAVKRWGQYGWTFIPNAPSGLFMHIVEDKNKCDKIALHYLHKKDMLNLFEELNRMNINHADLNEAIYCYNNKCYKACAMLLCALIDGIIYKCQKVNGAQRRKGNKNFFEQLRKNSIKEELLLQQFLLLQVDNLIEYMKKLFEQGNDFQLKTSVLNRNFLLHGMNKKSICQKECKQLFLAVYNTKMVIDSFNTEAQNKKLNISRLLELN